MALPSLSRDISPPPSRRSAAVTKRDSTSKDDNAVKKNELVDSAPTLAAIEAGEVAIRYHLEYFSKHLSSVARSSISRQPRMSMEDFQQLYRRNQHANGRHFVVHQHDHPVSDVHYDLRLQFSESSSVSFAIPYGLPGDPNSRRPNRMAIETRVHCLWNHLVESTSNATGSLLIWDTGEYEVLPFYEDKTQETDDELSDDAELDETSADEPGTQNVRLINAFRYHRIRLRLHGYRLPPSYTISMRLSKANHRAQALKPKFKRRRKDPALPKTTPNFDDEDAMSSDLVHNTLEETSEAMDSDDGGDLDIHAKNAYPGSSNTIGSIHQRHWFLRLDSKNSGFARAREGPNDRLWVGTGWDPFVVRGRDFEHSIVTGRLADEVMADDGVKDFLGRKMWRPIIE